MIGPGRVKASDARTMAGHEEVAMKAAVDDRLIVEATHGRSARHEGLVVRVDHADGSPPYLVRRLDTERESLVFPGPAARGVRATR